MEPGGVPLGNSAVEKSYIQFLARKKFFAPRGSILPLPFTLTGSAKGEYIGESLGNQVTREMLFILYLPLGMGA